jgi:hypothetical protein
MFLESWLINSSQIGGWSRYESDELNRRPIRRLDCVIKLNDLNDRLSVPLRWKRCIRVLRMTTIVSCIVSTIGNTVPAVGIVDLNDNFAATAHIEHHEDLTISYSEVPVPCCWKSWKSRSNIHKYSERTGQL